MSEHLTQHQLEQYVRGALSTKEAITLEKHAGACAPCGSALAKEASFELALYEVAAHNKGAKRVQRVATTAGVGIAGLAMAAAAILALRASEASNHYPARESYAHRTQSSMAFCADGADGTPCLAARGFDASWQPD